MSFPVIAKSLHSELVVMFLDKKQAVVLVGDYHYKVGETSSTLNECTAKHWEFPEIVSIIFTK